MLFFLLFLFPLACCFFFLELALELLATAAAFWGFAFQLGSGSGLLGGVLFLSWLGAGLVGAWRLFFCLMKLVELVGQS
jgi:hypothetical protein